jgi:hypothetical protein
LPQSPEKVKALLLHSITINKHSKILNRLTELLSGSSKEEQQEYLDVEAMLIQLNGCTRIREGCEKIRDTVRQVSAFISGTAIGGLGRYIKHVITPAFKDVDLQRVELPEP